MTASSASSSADAVFWSLVLVFGIGGLGAAIFALRRWLFSTTQSSSEPPWSLQHLRDLRAGGRITEEEFLHLKAQLLGDAASRKDGPTATSAHKQKVEAKVVKRPTDGSR